MAKRRKKDTGLSPIADAWDSAAELPRAGMPDTEAINKAFRRNRRYIRFAALAFPVVTILLLFAGLGMLTAEPEPAQDTAVEAAGRSQAMSATSQWLEADPAPLPGASLVSWDGFSELEPAESEDFGDEGLVQRQSHYLTIRSSTGTMLSAQVLVAIDPLGNAAAISDPSLSPVVPAQEHGGDRWPGLPGASLSDDAQAALRSWARAYTSGDPVALRQAVGDEDSANIYIPLSGVSDPEVNVLGSADIVTQRAGEQVPTGQVIAMVEVTLAWDGRDIERNQSHPVATYDVLIDGAHGGAPRVVAWGGPGTGTTLSAYDNALPAHIAAGDPDLVTEEED